MAAVRLKEIYRNEAAPALMKRFSIKSMQIPKLAKVVINVGCGVRRTIQGS